MGEPAVLGQFQYSQSRFSIARCGMMLAWWSARANVRVIQTSLPSGS